MTAVLDRPAATASGAPSCTPWCEEPGHPGAEHPDDLYCSGEPYSAPLTLHPPVLVDAGVYEVDLVWLHAYRAAGGGAPEIRIGQGEDGHATWSLTPGDARMLAAALVAVADEITGEHAGEGRS